MGEQPLPGFVGKEKIAVSFCFSAAFSPSLLLVYEIGNKILPKPKKVSRAYGRTELWYGTPNAHFSSFLRLRAIFPDREINNSFSIFLIIKHMRTDTKSGI